MSRRHADRPEKISRIAVKVDPSRDSHDRHEAARGLIVGLALSQIFWIALALLIF